jgi:hypothetical protein
MWGGTCSYRAAAGSCAGQWSTTFRCCCRNGRFRHNRWAKGEVAELNAKESGGRLQPDFHENPSQRKRFRRQKYDRMPLFTRPFFLFAYRCLLRLNFLDGTEGLIFWVLQTFSFRFLVDAKIWKRRRITSPAHK